MTTNLNQITLNVPTGDESQAAYTFNEWDVASIGAYGSGCITCKVHGYWSRDPMTLYVNRERTNWGAARNEANEAANYEWRFTMSHSSGGRDTTVVANDLIAEANFGRAMIALADVGYRLQQPDQIAALEAAYQIELKAREERQAALDAELTARIAADPAVGEHRAKALVDAASSMACLYDRPATIAMLERGAADDAEPIVGLTVRNTPSGRVSLRNQHGHALSRKDAIAMLASKSAARTTLRPVTTDAPTA